MDTSEDVPSVDGARAAETGTAGGWSPDQMEVRNDIKVGILGLHFWACAYACTILHPLPPPPFRSALFSGKGMPCLTPVSLDCWRGALGEPECSFHCVLVHLRFRDRRHSLCFPLSPLHTYIFLSSIFQHLWRIVSGCAHLAPESIQPPSLGRAAAQPAEQNPSYQWYQYSVLPQ